MNLLQVSQLASRIDRLSPPSNHIQNQVTASRLLLSRVKRLLIIFANFSRSVEFPGAGVEFVRTQDIGHGILQRRLQLDPDGKLVAS